MSTAFNYERQLEMADALNLLSERIAKRAVQVHSYVEDMRGMANALGRDFYTFVVADVLGIDYCDVMPFERWAAKTVLFAYTYGGTVTRIQDSVIVERSK